MTARRCKLIPYYDNGESRFGWIPIAQAKRGEVVAADNGRRWLIIDVDDLVCDDIDHPCLRVVAP